LHWPYPHAQPKQVLALVAEIEKLIGPVVIGGDFNMVPWSHALRQFASASRSDRAGPVVRTLIHSSGILRLPIDHILVPGGQGRL